MIAQLSHSVPAREPRLLDHRRQVRRVLGQELGRAGLAPDIDLFEVEPRRPDEDPNGQVVDARLEDVERDRGHVRLLLGSRGQYGFFGERSSDSDARERSTRSSIASARWPCVM